MNRYINQLSSLMDDIFSKYRKQKNAKEKVGVLVSGGIDSSIVAHYCKKYFPKQTVLFSFGTPISKDRPYVDLLQKHLDLPLIWLSINQDLITTSFNIVKKLLETINLSNSLMHLSLAAGYFLICQTSAQAGIRDIFTGQGPDVIMAGYSKYKRLMNQEAGNNELIKQAIIKDLDNLEIDKTRDNAM
ncbi:MAG: asparagine synthase C-terminal domain-containing protein, partial [Candidatus Omnitrophica bacterium]|nr:asparagine synthase C-terminal domain-containing protein [Candidatus Omnitrophota bacterium]